MEDYKENLAENLDSIKLLSPEQRATLKQAAHDWFETDKIWEETNTTLNEQYNPDEYEVFMKGNATGIRRKNRE